MMRYNFVVDVESDGPVPPIYSMVCFGAVCFSSPVSDDVVSFDTFYGETAPISKEWNPESLAISGISRQRHEEFDSPAKAVVNFVQWVKGICGDTRPVFWSDNLAYDWQWINYYTHRYTNDNPFGFSGRRIGDVYAGIVGDLRKPWKQLRTTSHTHNPVDDAMGNAEALIKIMKMLKEKNA